MATAGEIGETDEVGEGGDPGLAALVASGSLALRPPGGGATRERLLRLVEIAADDLELARLAEAHADAEAIAAEAGRNLRPGCTYGVWAADGPGSQLVFDPSTSMLRGDKAFCSGAGIVDRALVTCRAGSTEAGAPGLLFDIDARAHEITYDTSAWLVDAFRSTRTGSLHTGGFAVATGDQVGPAGFYLGRIGFWHGALAPAACWAGGTIGLIDHAVGLAHRKPAEPHLDAHVGALTALRWQLLALTARAGDEIDELPDDRQAAVVRARSYRHLVARAAWSAIDHVRRALGPRPFAHDPFVIARTDQIQLYVLQDHAEQDLDALGTAVRTAARADGT